MSELNTSPNQNAGPVGYTPNSRNAATAGTSAMNNADPEMTEQPLEMSEKRIIGQKLLRPDLAKMRLELRHDLKRLYAQGKFFDRRHVQPLKSRIQRSLLRNSENYDRTCAEFRETRLRPLRPYNEEAGGFVKGERLFGFGVDNREEGTQNPDDIYLRVTDEPVLGYHFASPDVLRKDTEPGFYGIMAGTGAFGSVPVHLECPLFVNQKKDGKRVFGKNKRNNLKKDTFQETSSDRTNTTANKDPNDISVTYIQNAEKDVNLARKVMAEQSRAQPEAEGHVLDYCRVKLEGETKRKRTRKSKTGVAADVLNTQYAGVLQSSRLQAELERERALRADDEREEEMAVEEAKKELELERAALQAAERHQRKLQLQQEIARKKAIKEEEERFLREADTGERFVAQPIKALQKSIDDMHELYGDLFPARKEKTRYKDTEAKEMYNVLSIISLVVEFYYRLQESSIFIRHYFSCMEDIAAQNTTFMALLQGRLPVEARPSLSIYIQFVKCGCLGDVVDLLLASLKDAKAAQVLQRHLDHVSGNPILIEKHVAVVVSCLENFHNFLTKDLTAIGGYFDKATLSLASKDFMDLIEVTMLIKLFSKFRSKNIQLSQGLRGCPFPILEKSNVEEWKKNLEYLSHICRLARSEIQTELRATWREIKAKLADV